MVWSEESLPSRLSVYYEVKSEDKNLSQNVRERSVSIHWDGVVFELE